MSLRVAAQYFNFFIKIFFNFKLARKKTAHKTWKQKKAHSIKELDSYYY